METQMIVKRTTHHRGVGGVAVAAFIIVAAATIALEFYAGHQLEYSGFTAGL
jgi:hypothetical protein